MREPHLSYLACPKCRGGLAVRAVTGRQGDRLREAELGCGCGAIYPVVRGIPRFVPIDNYASSFGLEWTVHARTQYDSDAGVGLSERRFFDETRWPRDLRGEAILEVGSGSGRFTEQAASTGALVVSFDYSYAVEANYQSNGDKDNVLIAQGDVFALPVKPASFDKLFCFGMLQHTPDVRGAFFALPAALVPGGELVVNVYKKTLLSRWLATKYYARAFTRGMDPARLHTLTRAYVDLMWPLARWISKVPRLGPAINWRLLVADYSRYGVEGDALKEWAYLDTFDMLAPRYDSPQTLATMKRWFKEAGLVNIDVHYGWNGVEGRGKRPA